ncbi:phytanoyl-CoA dioxygenase family protein [Sagittula sp. S175]|uniref:phytanoyl-CoA dioxygenase family protein n=1 Tax=Sagittula sp. S175 TaxID=3415129 RepID=UPI003C79ABC8
MSLMLSDDQIRQFETEGYLVVDNVLDTATLDAVRSEYAALLDRLYAGWETEGRVPSAGDQDFWQKLLTSYAAGCDWFQPMDISLPGGEITADTPFHFGPAVFDMITHKRLLDMVQDLIGPELTSNPIQHVRLKPPAPTLVKDEPRAHITATDWHQDKAVAHAEADSTRMVTVWLAISDATVENGCLQVVPGKPQMYPHCPQKQTAIAPGCLDETKALTLPVKAGGAVLFHPLTPHASLANQSQDFRWSFDIRFNVTGHPTGRSHFPSFIARSEAHPAAELRDWEAWKGLWEAARAELATRPHIPIHRWSSDAPVCA